MERILLEVDEKIAKAWGELTVAKRKDITNKVNIHLTRDLFEYDKESFKNYLDQLRNNMADRGLTQEILDEILNDES